LQFTSATRFVSGGRAGFGREKEDLAKALMPTSAVRKKQRSRLRKRFAVSLFDVERWANRLFQQAA
jgi:hypothetical protein